MIQIINIRIVSEYYQKGYTPIPLKNNSKFPIIKWKQYQSERASLKETLHWFVEFKEPNLGLVTGRELIVIDLDDIEKLPELKKILPEIDSTTRVKTKRPGYHFYFSNDGHKIRSADNLFSLEKVNLYSKGRQVVAPPSKRDGFTYSFEVPLSEIRPLPKKIIDEYSKEMTLPGTGTGTGTKEGSQAPGVEYKKRIFLSLPRYNGQDRYCIKQILGKELKVGERDSSLFILYNLLLQNKNRLDHAKKITILKNNSLAKPLTYQEMEKLFKKGYRFKCSTIRETLPFIECDKCKFKFKGGRLGMGNILVKNIRKLLELSSTEARIALLLGTVFDGEYPSVNMIAKKTKMNSDTVKNAINVLKKKGIIDKSLYN